MPEADRNRTSPGPDGYNRGWTYTDRLGKAEAGQSVLAFYTQRYPHSSRSQWQQRLNEGQIRLNDMPATGAEILQRGHTLTYHRPPWQEPPAPLKFAVLHADADLLVIHKPSGLPVLPGGNFLEHTLLHQLTQQFPNERLVPVHRLGRATSGALLVARSALARSVLSRQMRQSTEGTDRTLHKQYLALVGPGFSPDRCTLTTPIGPVPYAPLGQVHAASAHGKSAHSVVDVLERRPDATLLAVTIRTGRPHQIRIHLAAAGFPLLGDPLYASGGLPYPVDANNAGAGAVPGDGGYFLHAHRLHLSHPRTEQPLTVVAEPPPLLRSTISEPVPELEG